MATTVRLNFAKPPGILGLLNIGNTQTMKAGKQEDHSIVINVDPAKHLNADGSFKKLDELINDPTLSEKERKDFLALKSADHVELLGHGMAGGDAIYSNPAQNFPTNHSTSWYGETKYKAEHIGAFLADCDKGPNINVISCHGASTEEGQSICTRLRAALNKKALSQGKPTGAIQGYTRACGIDGDGGVFLSVNSKEDRKCAQPWWSRIPVIGAILSFFANLWDALFGSGGPRKGTAEYGHLKAQAEKDSVLVDDNCVTIQQNTSKNAPEADKLDSSVLRREDSVRIKQTQEQKPALNAHNLQKIKNTATPPSDAPVSMAVMGSMTAMDDMTTLQSGVQGIEVLPTKLKQESAQEQDVMDRENTTELSV